MAQEAKFTANFKLVTINKAAWKRQLNKRLEKEIKLAAQTWLNATVLLVIPVWSGASRGTFRKLASAVGFSLTITGLESDHPRALGPQVGFQRSEGFIDKSQISKGLISFVYGTSLFHLVFNEFNNANQNPTAGRLFAKLKEPGPYNFQKVGQAAFEDYAKDTDILPSPWDYLKKTELRV